MVSSSAPASSIDMESLVRGANIEIANESDYRDRRKKDIHNMSRFSLQFLWTIDERVKIKSIFLLTLFMSIYRH